MDRGNKDNTAISEILPKSGLVYSEKGGYAEVLCKPKILPLKSAVLEQLQKIEQQQREDMDNQDGNNPSDAFNTHHK